MLQIITRRSTRDLKIYIKPLIVCSDQRLMSGSRVISNANSENHGLYCANCSGFEPRLRHDLYMFCYPVIQIGEGDFLHRVIFRR